MLFMLSSFSVGIGKHIFFCFPRNLQRQHRLLFQSSVSMNNELQTETHVHYNTLIPPNTQDGPLESFQFMYARPWQRVDDFYLNIVRANLSLPLLFGAQTLVVDHNDTGIAALSDTCELESVATEDRSGRRARTTIVEGSLGKFVDEKKTQLLKDNGLPIEGCAVVAGRTDKGVTGLQQVCSFYTWKKDVKPRDIEDAINHATPGKFRVISVSEVSRVFHPNFSAKWRRYLYIFPLTNGRYTDQSNDNGHFYNSCKYNEIHDSASKDELENGKKSYMFSTSKVNRLLRKLEGKLLSYKMFARDTKASRNDGPPTECFVYHARAMEVKPPTTDHGEETKVMCVELVADRFLRKMVRVLVATSIREAAAGAEDDALIKLMDATCRRATAPPAPPDGLCLVDVGYTEFDPKKCFILIE
ncbi:hypothetical protein JHK87_013595 [Glycine soja]|nr:hypothetical protein JHK87_013595 [Glycine soja]